MTRVIKVGGRTQSDPALATALAEAWAPARVDGWTVVVHGGGDEISQLQSQLGGTAEFSNGRRVTTARDVEIVQMALSGRANKRLVATLVDRGISAIGLSGEDAALIDASPMDAERLGRVGVPTAVNVTLLRHLLSGGYLPVISPVSRDSAGATGALNVNGDDAAAAIATALGATEMLLVTDVPGVMRNGQSVLSLSRSAAEDLFADGTVAGGMRAKLEAGFAAIEGGVSRVRVSDIGGITDLARGTALVRSGEVP